MNIHLLCNLGPFALLFVLCIDSLLLLFDEPCLWARMGRQ